MSKMGNADYPNLIRILYIYINHICIETPECSLCISTYTIFMVYVLCFTPLYYIFNPIRSLNCEVKPISNKHYLQPLSQFTARAAQYCHIVKVDKADTQFLIEGEY